MTPESKKLIVNADDLGRTPGINAGIFAAHSRGIVTSATLMVGFEAAIEAGRELEKYPALGIGLHVTLTGCEPILPPAQLPSLVDKSGRFPAKPEGHIAPALDEVRAEIDAQLARFEELTGRLPTHLDSHHHSHRLPVICDALAETAQRLGIPARDSGHGIRPRLSAAGVPTTDRFVEEFFGAAATEETLRRIVSRLELGVTEIMCHPAVIDDLLREGSSYVDERETELAVLTDPAIRQLIDDEDIELITFAAL